MSLTNPNLKYRPLRGGISVYNPVVGHLGTIGAIGTSNGTDRWIISCYHVLCRAKEASFDDGEPIYQPDDSCEPVAKNSFVRSNAVLDCAGALILPEIDVSPEILGLPTAKGWDNPQVGMRVVKSGRVTGITEGIIKYVEGHVIGIEVLPGYPGDYVLSEPGDSGAAWVCVDTWQIVALHTSGTVSGKRVAYATKMSSVLGILGLELV